MRISKESWLKGLNLKWINKKTGCNKLNYIKKIHNKKLKSMRSFGIQLKS